MSAADRYRRYRTSAKGQATQKRYRVSAAGRAVSRRYYQAHRQQILDRDRLYRKGEKAQLLARARNRKFYAAHREQQVARVQRWYAALSPLERTRYCTRRNLARSNRRLEALREELDS